MPIETIYITRHGHRLAYAIDPSIGTYRSTHPTPTRYPADVPLASHGVQQSHELASYLSSILPPQTRIYCSPYYRCLQTLVPAISKFREQWPQNRWWEVRCENGLEDWYGTAPFPHPSTAPLSHLQTLFPSLLSTTHTPNTAPPNPHGETIAQLHARIARTLTSIISHLDTNEPDITTLLICTHAAPLIAMGRALTGHMPSDPSVEDFRPYTTGISKFVRQRTRTPTEIQKDRGESDEDWQNGPSICGRWTCTLNGDCSFLSSGAERGWHFDGEESFFGTYVGDGESGDEGGVILKSGRNVNVDAKL